MQDYKKEAAEFVIWKSAISRQSMKIVFEILQHETGGLPNHLSDWRCHSQSLAVCMTKYISKNSEYF